MSDADNIAMTLAPGRSMAATRSSWDNSLAMEGEGAVVSHFNSASSQATVYVRVKGYKDCSGPLASDTPGVSPIFNNCVNIRGPYTVNIQR